MFKQLSTLNRFNTRMISISSGMRTIRTFSAITSQSLKTDIETSNTPKNQNSFLFFLDPHKTKHITYLDTISLNVGKPLSPLSKRIRVDAAISRNPELPIDYIFNKRYWNIDDFDNVNQPIIIDNIIDGHKFSMRDNRKNSQINDQELWTLDLPIKMPGKGWAIPSELAQFGEFIQKADEFEQIINPHYDNCYAYFCVDQRPVKPGKSQRRPGYHADSFITPYTHGNYSQSNILHDSIYIAYDCIPTVFNPGPFIFPNMKVATNPSYALKYFDNMANPSRDYVLDPYQIIKLDPTIVHKVGINSEKYDLNRTFAKLIYSTEIFNRMGNDKNLLFDYNWPMIDRNIANRNTSSVCVEVINGHKYSEYKFLSRSALWLMINNSDSEVILAQKQHGIIAYPATPRELLQTVVNGVITTQNVAKDGDWKVTTRQGDQYFLPISSLKKFYNHCELDTDNPSSYNFIPKPQVVKAIKIKGLIQFHAPWSFTQYLMPGDYLIMRYDEIYGVKKESFESNYCIL